MVAEHTLDEGVKVAGTFPAKVPATLVGLDLLG
jgi:hypothetical protein